MKCPRCLEQGQPIGFGSRVTCAFEGGPFCSDNWMCATANRLRSLLPATAVCLSGDSSAALVPTEEYGFLLVAWYKRRGRTDRIEWLCDDESRRATLADVDYVIARLEQMDGVPISRGGSSRE